jgi:hypothetical protein
MAGAWSYLGAQAPSARDACLAGVSSSPCSPTYGLRSPSLAPARALPLPPLPQVWPRRASLRPWPPVELLPVEAPAPSIAFPSSLRAPPCSQPFPARLAGAPCALLAIASRGVPSTPSLLQLLCCPSSSPCMHGPLPELPARLLRSAGGQSLLLAARTFLCSAMVARRCSFLCRVPLPARRPQLDVPPMASSPFLPLPRSPWYSSSSSRCLPSTSLNRPLLDAGDGRR